MVADLVIQQVADLGMCRQPACHDHVAGYIDWNENFVLLGLVDDDDRSVGLGELLRRQRPRVLHEGFYRLLAELVCAGRHPGPQKNKRGQCTQHNTRSPKATSRTRLPTLSPPSCSSTSPAEPLLFSLCRECSQNTSVAVNRTAALHIASMPIRLASLSPKLGQIKAPRRRACAPRLCPVRAWQLCHEACELLDLSR